MHILRLLEPMEQGCTGQPFFASGRGRGKFFWGREKILENFGAGAPRAAISPGVGAGRAGACIPAVEDPKDQNYFKTSFFEALGACEEFVIS